MPNKPPVDLQKRVEQPADAIQGAWMERANARRKMLEGLTVFRSCSKPFMIRNIPSTNPILNGLEGYLTLTTLTLHGFDSITPGGDGFYLSGSSLSSDCSGRAPLAIAFIMVEYDDWAG
jgi:hypothetical protein